MTDKQQTFNTPLEAGLRVLFLLDAAGRRRGLDLQRLMYFDYALVHTHDLDGPPSIHPLSPSKDSQLLVRRALIQDGLDLMRSRDLIDRTFQAKGIGYRVTAVGQHLASEFGSTYADALRARAAWVIGTLDSLSDVELRELFEAQVAPFADELILDDGTGPEELGSA